MGAEQDDDGDDSELIAVGYSAMLREIADRARLKNVDIIREGVSKSLFYRVVPKKLSGSGSKQLPGAPIRSASEVRAAMLRLRPDLEIPPPTMLVESAEHFEWLRVGTELLHENPEAFRQILAQAKEAVSDILEAKRLLRRGLSLVGVKPDDT